MNDDIEITVDTDFVATVEICKPPNNFFSNALISGLADVFESLDLNDDVRISVLCSEGKHFCAGADFSGNSKGNDTVGLYAGAVRIFRCNKPIVAAIQGAAIGGGLGLALAADFRIAAPEARFSANFARLGFHQGFGLSVTLPELIGPQASKDMFFTGRRVKGEEAFKLGLCDQLVSLDKLREAALSYAKEIAISAPLAVEAIRKTLRGDLADRVEIATLHEAKEQARLVKSDDWGEGIAASAERRDPAFQRK
ncbi:MAG: enoyl-CoA hydratase/isomerase family protein [Acidimicrobiales bacterium]|jgi:enoyl-CoA hydratase/carnithine racemase|nr:enoyl-CoA hydratase/isomerase family protein [Acidimicrobiales bacterium]MDP6298078.1 enoyl-CoA hydratase/isomerase family protein [Acidimicrobiales bacterium]HJM28439.1 enoyl-CoA hydratase/isomerase family protein [Acidimicrobiales bacterium]